jgi:5-(carboxyamino)imidazole ribonucleotide mutase
MPSPKKASLKKTAPPPRVGVIMGSDSDFETMQGALDVLHEFKIAHEVKIVSAHRTPDDMARYAKSARRRGLKVIIAGAGGAAHLPGMTASYTTLPVIGVPVQSKMLSGVDSLYSIVQMPAGIPVATVAIGNAKNAGLLAAQILSIEDTSLAAQLETYRKKIADDSRGKNQLIKEKLRKK